MLSIVERNQTKQKKGGHYMHKAVAENLKKYRLNKQLTQAEASEILGVSTKSISKWECGLTLPFCCLSP